MYVIISDELCNYKPISLFKVTIWLTVSTGFFLLLLMKQLLHIAIWGEKWFGLSNPVIQCLSDA